MWKKKYRFLSVRIKIPNTRCFQLTIRPQVNKAFLYGPTKIIEEDYDICCEKGFYDTQNQSFQPQCQFYTTIKS